MRCISIHKNICGCVRQYTKTFVDDPRRLEIYFPKLSIKIELKRIRQILVKRKHYLHLLTNLVPVHLWLTKFFFSCYFVFFQSGVDQRKAKLIFLNLFHTNFYAHRHLEYDWKALLAIKMIE